MPETFTASDLELLGQSRIYFGHQSVGYNLLAGLQASLPADLTTRWPIVETEAPLVRPGLAHSKVGRNEHPETKLAHFRKVIEGGLGENLDLAMVKLCYIDFAPDTDVDRLFNAYRATIDELKRVRPRTTFIHVTAPLQRLQGGPKAMVKRLMGRALGGERENDRRHRYSLMLRDAFANEPIFDLAVLQATAPDGTHVTSSDGKVPAMCPAYTDDGGHLNATGEAAMGPVFLKFLVKTLRERGAAAPHTLQTV